MRTLRRGCRPSEKSFFFSLSHTHSFTHTYTSGNNGCQTAVAALHRVCAVLGRGWRCLRSLAWELQERRESGSGAAELSRWRSSPFPLLEKSEKDRNRGKKLRFTPPPLPKMVLFYVSRSFYWILAWVKFRLVLFSLTLRVWQVHAAFRKDYLILVFTSASG